MIIETGHFALILTLVLSLVQAILPWQGANRANTSWKQSGRQAAIVSFILLSVAFFSLMVAHVSSDFSVLNVAQNSHTLKPLLYKITGVWGNHEGSMLLWVWILGLWGFCVAEAKLPLPLKARILAIQGMMTFGFTLFILFTSNPFARLSPPVLEGVDLNPVLQDIGLAIHPPLLYTGYVGFSIAFCFAIAALRDGKIDKQWAAQLRPWVLAAWVALTAGITSGAVWAYYELGWGGFWFWDPVENASLMPWLTGTALLHSVVVLEKRDTLRNWTVFLAMLAFSFSLLGTFLVRSGVLTSVHAFATDPTRGIFILALLTVAIGGAFLFYALYAPQVKSGEKFSIISRETTLLLNNVFLFTFCFTVFTGTLYPLFLSALNLGSVSVGPPYYKATMLPLLLPFALLMGLAPLMVWRETPLKSVFKKLRIPFILMVILLSLITLSPVKDKPLSLLGFLMGGWIVATTGYDAMRKTAYFKKPHTLPLSYYGMMFAHIGFGILLMGITATTLWKSEKILWMQAGDTMEIADQKITFLGTNAGQGKNFNKITGVFTLGDNDTPYPVFMSPEKRWYPVTQKETSEVALHVTRFDIIYLVMGDQDTNIADRWVIRVYYHPLVLWILIGAMLIALGGGLSFFDRKRRHE